MAILQKTGVTGSLSISSSGIRPTTSASLFNVNGYNGRLLNVVDTLSGSLFSVNSIAGLPIFEVLSNNKVIAGKYNANDFVISGSRVGIGTNTPAYKLDVQSTTATARLGNAIVGSWPSNSPYATFGHNSLDQTNAGNYAVLQFSNGTTYLNAASGQNLYFRIANTDAMMIDSSRNVGIGTTAFIYSATNRGLLEIYGSTDSLIGLKNSTANAYIQKTGNDFYLNNGGAGFISITTNASERMRIASDGNVGMGTTSPNAKLHISSSAAATLRIETRASSGADSEIEFVGPDTHSYAMGIDESDSDKFKISYAASRTPPTLGTNDRFVIQTDGKIGIGTTVAEDLLSVGNINIGTNYGSGYNAIWLNGGTTTSDFNFLSSPSDTILYINAPASKYIVNQIGNFNRFVVADTYSSTVGSSFGVNMAAFTTAPSYTLDVAGTLRATGDVGLGGAPDTGARLYVQGEGLTEPFLSVQTCLGNNSTSTATYNTLKGYLAVKIGNNVGTSGNLITAGTYYLRLWGA